MYQRSIGKRFQNSDLQQDRKRCPVFQIVIATQKGIYDDHSMVDDEDTHLLLMNNTVRIDTMLCLLHVESFCLYAICIW